MDVIFLALFLVSSVGLAFVGYYAFQLRITSARLETELAAQKDRDTQDTKQLNEHCDGLKAKLQSLVEKYNENVKKWNDGSASLKGEIQRLTKWKDVADADAVAAQLRQEASAISEQAKAQASKMLSDADSEATAVKARADEEAASVVADAKKKAKALTAETEGILTSATAQAARIVDAANKRAEEIAGTAYEAVKSASTYEQAAKAMKNLVEGYGDKFIVPPQALFDTLADDFGFAQAGQELKRARECVRVMIRNGTAAACDYVEANRRETAVNFVVDAFNGKVDSIMSRTKHDNAGKLAQQIRDAFALVNLNGKAFRDARITDQYLDARLDELKWASAVQHLLTQDREEQREAKEKAREDARAAKEIASAMREAAKEEATLQKAMEQAKEQFELASGEQKAMYEARLNEMTQRLQEAMARKDRARSMAEQTKKGHIYIISNIGSFGDDVFKIGLTRRWDPRDRIVELGGASVPFGFDVHAMIMSDDAPALEQRLHEHFMLKQVNKINHRKEFFRVSLGEIRGEIEKLGLSGVSWTMTATAKEYRETLATEKKIAEDSSERDRWIKQQRHLETESAEDGELVGALADDE